MEDAVKENEMMWKRIEGYDNRYEVSDHGQIKSLCKKQLRVLRPGVNSAGYHLVVLYKDKHKKNCYVHRLVAKAFIPNPNNLPEINHKNENKLDNRVNNLEWCEKSYNINYGTRNEKSAKVFSKPVSQYSLDGNLINIFSGLVDAEKTTGISKQNISKCCKGGRKQAGGYRWEYKNCNRS